MGKTKIVLNQQSDLILNNAQILQPTGIVKSDLPGLVEDIAGITMSIAAEATARTAADIKLTDDLAAETSARIADVDAEEARAIAAETKLTSDLSSEVSRATAAENQLSSDLADETAARIADVNAEETRALAAEGVLQSNIDVQAGRIDAILDGSDVNLDQFKEVVDFVNSIDLANDNALLSAVTTINSEITAEEAARIAGDAQLSADLATETAARIADVNAEETRALAAEAALSSDISSLQSYVDTTVDSAIATLTSDLATETAARIADVDAEEARALAAEAALSADLTDLQSYVDTTVNSAIETLTADLATETSARVADVDAEEARAMTAEAQLTTDLASEVSRAQAAEVVLQSNIDVEKGRIDAILDGSDVNLDQFREVVAFVESIDLENDNSLLSAVMQINSDIDSETARAEAAESTLQSNLDIETASRIAGDAQLQSNLDAAIAQEVVDRTAAIAAANVDITNETSARVAGDAQLQSEIDALALTDGETIDVNYAANTIRLKEVVAAPDSGVRTFEGDIKVGQQPDTLPSYNDSSLITKGILDSRVSNEVSTLNTTISDEVSRAQNAEAQLQSNIDTERERIDAILLASDADKDSFAEIVQLINSVDTENDQAFASYVLSNDARLTAEEQERLRLTNLLGEGLITEQITREDGDAALQHEFDILPMTDGETIELNYTDNTIRLKEFVNMPDSGVRVFEGDIKADSQPENRGTFNELSYVTKNYVDNKVTNDLSDAVAQEMAERIAADAALTELIDVKKGEAIAISNEYTDVETQRASSVEGYLQSEIDTLALTDGDTIDVNYASNTIRLKEVVAAPDSGVRTFEGDIKVGDQPSSLPSYNEFSLITKGIMDTRLSEEVGNINTSISDEITRAQDAEAQLQMNIDTERGRIDAILMASDADKDSFAEIVQLINSVDTDNDQAFASYVLSNDARLTAEEQERLRLTNLLGEGLVTEQIAREDADAAIHYELNNLPMTDGETIDVNYVDNTIKLKDIVAAPTSGYRVFEGDLKLNAQPDTNPNFNDLSLITKYYVDNKVSTDLTSAIEQEEADRIAADAGLMSDLAAEVSRAQSVEASLQAAIDAETTARLTADADLDSRIVDIVSNSNAPIIDSFTEVVASLDDLRSDLTIETDDRIAADAQLSSDLDAETAARIADVDAEETRAIAAEEALQAAIDAEVAARIAADAGLDSRINDIISNTNAPIIDSFTEVVAQMEAMPGIDDTSIFVDSQNNISLKDTIAAGSQGVRTFNGLVNVGSEPSLDTNFVDLSLVTKGYVTGLVDAEETARIAAVSSEEARALAAEAALSATFSTALSAEITRATFAELTLSNDLSDETAARIFADTQLQSNIDVEKGRIDAILLASDADKDSFAEIVTLINSVDTENDQAFASYVLSNNAALAAEVLRAETSEAALSSTFSAALSAEEAARIAGDAQLSSDLADLQSYVDTTVDSAIATLTSDLADETAARIADVDAEEARALAAEAALSATFSTALAAETFRAQAAEVQLSNDLSDETSYRIAADTVLQSNIDVEKGRIDAILLASDADKDSFAEIVTLINSVDTENDQAFASYVLSNNAAISSLSSTFSAALSAEESARIAADAQLSSDLADLQSYVDTTVDSAIATLTSDLADETAARIADVDAEEARALAAEALLQTNINTEANERMAEDITLQGNIDIEASRAQIAETAIASDLADEISTRIAAVFAEETRAMLAEAALVATFSTAIFNEEARALAAEVVLQSNIDTEKGRIDAILLASDADKDSFAEIVALINSVDTTNDQAFASYVLSNDAALAAEVLRAETAEASLSATFSAAISTEEARAMAAELVLTNDLASEVSRATAAEASLTSALSAEEASRIAGDSALQSSLNNEIADRIAAGQAAQTALDSETTRAMAAEATLTSDLASEVSRAMAAELVLTNDLASEVSRALAAEASLSATFSAALAAETFRAQTAEIQLSNDLSDEASYRIDADTLLQSNIDTEKARIDAILLASDADKDSFAEIVSLINSVDTTNDTAFASYVLSNDAALASEVSRALAAEASLSATFSAAISAETAARIADVDAEETRALAAEAALATDFANIYCKKVSVSGTPNGVLTSFSLVSPVRLGSEMIYLNGLLMEEGEDYTTVLTSGKVTSVTFSSAPTSVMKVVAYGVY